MAQSATSINTHQDLVEYDEIFKRVRVDDETGMVSVNDTLKLFELSQNNTNTYIKRLKNKLPNLKVIKKKINNTGQTVRLIHPSSILLLLTHLNTPRVKTFLTNILQVDISINTYQDLCNYDDIFIGLQVDIETGMIAINEILRLFELSQNNTNTFFNRLKNKLPNLKVIKKK